MQATIELENEAGYFKISDGHDYGDEGAELDRSPKGVFSTEFTTIVVSGSFQVGGYVAGEEVPVRRMTFTVHLHAPECYIGHGAGVFSRITMRYPHGLPPAGKPEVILDAPTPDLATSFAQAFATWQELRR